MQGQGHGWGQSFKSQLGSNIILSIHPLIPMIELFKNLPLKSNVKVTAQGHIISITSYPLISLLFHVDLFLWCSYLRNWPWKSKVKVMGEVYSENARVCAKWQWNARDCVTGLHNRRSRECNPVTPVECVSLSFRTHTCVLTFITYIMCTNGIEMALV